MLSVERLQFKVDLVRRSGEGMVLAEETLDSCLQLLAPLFQLAHLRLQLVEAALQRGEGGMKCCRVER